MHPSAIFIALSLLCCLTLSMPMASADCTGLPPSESISSRPWHCVGDQWTYNGSILIQSVGSDLEPNATWILPYPLTIFSPARITGDLTLNMRHGIVFHPPIDLAAWNKTMRPLLTIDGSFLLVSTGTSSPSVNFTSTNHTYIQLLEKRPSSWKFDLIQSENNVLADVEGWNLREDGLIEFNNRSTCLQLSNSFSASRRSRSYFITSNIEQRPFYGTCYRGLPKRKAVSPLLILMYSVAGSIIAGGLLLWLYSSLGKRRRAAIWKKVLSCTCCDKKPAKAHPADQKISGVETDALLHFTHDPNLKTKPVFATLAAYDSPNDSGDELPLPDPSLDDTYFSDSEHVTDTIPLQEWNSDPNEGSAAAFVSHEAHRY